MLKRLIKKFSTVLIVTTVLAVALFATNVAGLWSFNRSQSASVYVTGSGVTLYKDLACTQELLPADVFSFGTVKAGDPIGSTPVNIYAKNMDFSPDPVYVSISHSGTLPAYLTMKTGSSVIPLNPTKLQLYTPAVTGSISPAYMTGQVPGSAVGYWNATDTTLCFYDTTLTPNGTLPAQLTGSPNFYYILVDSEIMKVTAAPGTTSPASKPVLRGQLGTTAAAHNGGATIYWATYNTASPTYILPAPASGGILTNTVKTIPLYMLCGDNPTQFKDTTGFSIIIDAVTTP